MGRCKRLDTLPEVKEYLDKLISQGKFTQKQLAEITTEYAISLGHDAPITEKVVNRYAASFKDIMQKREERASVVKQWSARMGDVPDGDFGRVLIEIIRQLSFDFSISLTEEGMSSEKLPESIKMLKNLTTSVNALERSASENQKRDAQIKDKAKREATELMSIAAKASGVSEETINRIRVEVLGMSES